jgi:hypothetical protein
MDDDCFEPVTSTKKKPPFGRAIVNTQTPAEYVASHELTLRLKDLGVTDDQLEAMRFRPKQESWPFAQWSFTWGVGTPLAAIPLIKPYCALKWLFLENPEYSRDKDDAWHLVSVTVAAPIYRIGFNHKEAQRLRAKKPRSKFTEDGQSTERIIEHLALNPEHLDETANELWNHFFHKLDEAKLRPKEEIHSDPRKRAYTYRPSNGTVTSITYGRFANLVSKHRKKSR